VIAIVRLMNELSAGAGKAATPNPAIEDASPVLIESSLRLLAETADLIHGYRPKNERSHSFPLIYAGRRNQNLWYC
jgi:hypothetical protein